MSAFKSVKNLECLCFKDTSSKPTGAGGIVKAKLSASASIKSTCKIGRGKLSSIKTHDSQKIKYCILEGIHEIGRWDIANKCPNDTKFECFNL